MNKKNILSILIIVLLLVFVLSACGGRNTETDIAVSVALTQTAAAIQEQEPASSPAIEALVTSTNTPQVLSNPVVVSGYQPYDGASCAALAASLNSSVGISGEVVSPVPFTDILTGESGNACQIAYSASAATYSGDMLGAAQSTLIGLGWVEDFSYGAGGPGAFQTSFRKDSTLCVVAYEFKPIDRALCNSDEIFATCMDRLSADQKINNLKLTCTTYFL